MPAEFIYLPYFKCCRNNDLVRSLMFRLWMLFSYHIPKFIEQQYNKDVVLWKNKYKKRITFSQKRKQLLLSASVAWSSDISQSVTESFVHINQVECCIWMAILPLPVHKSSPVCLNNSLSVGLRQHKACFQSVSFNFRRSFLHTDLQFVLTGIQLGGGKKALQYFRNSPATYKWHLKWIVHGGVEGEKCFPYKWNAWRSQSLLHEQHCWRKTIFHTEGEWNTAALIGKIIEKTRRP